MFFINILGVIMKFLYGICHDYGVAIILFTVISKIILLPISVWVHKNSIKMVKMQPEINRIKIKYYGDKDKIADEQSELYKKNKYNPLASLIPLFIQIVLLLGLVQVINHPLTYITKFDNNTTKQLTNITVKNNNLSKKSSSLEINVVRDIKSGNYIKEYKRVANNDINKIEDLNLDFLGFDLCKIATQEHGIAYLVPLIAGLSSLILCLFQNAINVLQSAQSKFGKYSTLLFSVGLSVYLGMFVPAGVALYWTASNLLTIVQLLILNREKNS